VTRTTARRLIKTLIAVTLAAGVSLLLYTAYRAWDPGAAARQRQLATQLENSWRKPLRHHHAITAEPRLVTGEPFAFIQIPRFGPHWRFTIVEGTSLTQLATGPGHVPGTQLPGQRGNFAVAAHDITAGNPFLHLRDLRPGDRVIVTTRYAVFRYRVVGQRVVRYTDSAVLAAVPGHPGKRARKSMITLITCTPVTLAFTPYRIVVTGTEISATAARHRNKNARPRPR
jgi:sortase A